MCGLGLGVFRGGMRRRKKTPTNLWNSGLYAHYFLGRPVRRIKKNDEGNKDQLREGGQLQPVLGLGGAGTGRSARPYSWGGKKNEVEKVQVFWGGHCGGRSTGGGTCLLERAAPPSKKSNWMRTELKKSY